MPKGITLRTYPSGRKALQIAFTYKGVECREIISVQNPGSASARKYAENLRGAILDSIQRGTFNYAEYFPDSPKARLFGHAQAAVTVSEAQQGLIDDLRTAGREETTLKAYARSAGRINAYLGKIKVSDLVPEHIREMLRKRQVSRKTWNNDLIPLRKALKRAVMDGAIPFNPLDRIDIDELVPKLEKPKPDPFTLAEITAILAAGGDTNLYQVALMTGLRLEELVALTWSDIDFNAGTLEVNKAAQLSIQSSETKAPKTVSGYRTVDLLPKAVEALRNQEKLTRFRTYVFLPPSLKPINRYRQVALPWKRHLKAVGVRYRPFKQCRHTFISHMLLSDYNPVYLISQTGHKTINEMNPYIKCIQGWKDEERRYGT